MASEKSPQWDRARLGVANTDRCACRHQVDPGAGCDGIIDPRLIVGLNQFRLRGCFDRLQARYRTARRTLGMAPEQTL
jgi:hypothetical protein